jgi:hypothetical protein
VLGGPLDKTMCVLSPDASQLGFFVWQDGEDEDPQCKWWGYHAHELRDGFRVFRPGKPPLQGAAHITADPATAEQHKFMQDWAKWASSNERSET